MTGRSSNFDTVDFNHQGLTNHSVPQQEPQQKYQPIPQNYQQIQGSSRPQFANDLGERSEYEVKTREPPAHTIQSVNQSLPNHRVFQNHQQISRSFPDQSVIGTLDLTDASKYKVNPSDSSVKTAISTTPNSSNLPISQYYRKIPISSAPQVAADLPDEPNYGMNGSGRLAKKRKLMQRLEPVATKAPNDLRESLFTDGASRAPTLNQFKSPTITKEPSIHASAANSLPSGKKASTSGAHSMPVFPIRPYVHRPKFSKRADTLAIERAAVKHVVQVEPYRPEPPPSVPRYQGGGTADFYPWTGNHPEDVVNELTTKQGSCEKTPFATSGNSSARPTLWSSLRHKSGLGVLSTMFVSALQQRQTQGTIAANSAFKPPPRVTLTETRREAWLKDFADLAIPLRRLSRRIPHGITGKILLDQCLAKDIPITRAIWLAKCVGANEIRSIKRKGTSGPFAFGGETRWIRDWTKSVETFLESIVGDCGTPMWRDRMSYSLRLVSHLFSEYLLDQDQLLDWMIVSLQSSDLHSLAVWLLIIQAFWKQTLRCWERARRLAEALLGQLWKVYPPSDREAYAEIFQQLAQLLHSFILANPLCFLLRSWSKYEPMLKDCLVESENTLSSIQLERLSNRNSRLRRPFTDQGQQFCENSSQQKLINLLDSLPIRVRIGHLADACMRTVGDHSLLIKTCLEWATNIYRNGHARLYIVVRLLRKWASNDISLDVPIQEFLCTNQSLPQRQKANVFRILADLVHSKDFLISHYMGWLNAKGSMIPLREKSGQPMPFEVQLLLELPEYKLPYYVVNLRRTLLSRIGASPKKEDDAIAATKARVASQIQNFFPDSKGPARDELPSHDSNQLSRTVKSAVGRWILQTAVSRLQVYSDERRQDFEDDIPIRNLTEDPAINLEQFWNVRKILESFEDFPVLADIINVCCNSADIKVLIAATDTANDHINVFMAIGATNGLFNCLYQRYEEYVRQKTFEPCFVESLIDLGTHLPGSAEEVRKLRKALLYHERVLSAAPCSPVSDHMADTLQSAAPAFLDEVEQVLSSGTSMDKQTFSKLFRAITKQMESSWADPLQTTMIQLAEVLLRLRHYGAQRFTESVHTWLNDLLSLTHRPNLSRILLLFICSAAITLKTILEKLVILLTNTVELNHIFGLDGLELLIITDSGLPSFSKNREYRLHNQQLQIIKESANLTIPMLRATISACSSEEKAICERAQALIKNPGTKTIVKGLLQQYPTNPDAISQAFGSGPLERNVLQVIDDMLYPSSESGVRDADLQNQLPRLLGLANHFNVPLCQLKLRAVLATASENSFDFPNSLVTVIIERAKSTADAVPDIWAALISGLSSEQALQICERAENEIFSRISMRTVPVEDHRATEMEALLEIVDAGSSGIPDFGTPLVVMQVTDMFENMLNDPEAMSDGLALCINILLRLLSIHQSPIHTLKLIEENVTHLLTTLSLLLIHPSLCPHPNLSEHILDTLCLLTETLSETARAECVRRLKDHYKTHDPRLLFIFGYAETDEDECLQVKEGELGEVGRPFRIRRWEMMSDVTPLPADNDTSISLTLFGARRGVL